MIALGGILRDRKYEEDANGATVMHRIAEIYATRMKRLLKIEAADDQRTEPATNNRRRLGS
jgi:hypothetical protein